MKTHCLKTWPEFYRAILSGAKTFEARKNDRDYREGDELVLMEWEPCKQCGGFGRETPDDVTDHPCSACRGDKGKHTGRSITKSVSYVMRGPAFGVSGGYCVMAIREAKQ